MVHRSQPLPSSPAPAQAGSVRLFFALWPDAATVRMLTQWAQQAHAACGGRIMRPDTLHLTLAFLGDTPPEVVHALAQATATQRIAPGVVTLSRFGAFARPGIVWAGPADGGMALARSSTVQPTDPPLVHDDVDAGSGPHQDDGDDEGAARLQAEHRRLWDWVGPLHPARPENRFRPHVTLLRNADTRQSPPTPAAPIVWRYDRYVLVASTQNGASRYRIVAATRA
jgi:2'-5' RNA ligase